MKNLFFISTLFLSLCINSQVKEKLHIPKNAKIGLSLSGGGAKGFAHVGVLKVLDSLGVKIDYISGTSMGAVVGGLYASGYSGKDIEKIMNDADFYDILSNQKSRKETPFFDKSVDKYIISLPIKKRKISLPSSISSGQRTFYILKELFKNTSDIKDFSQLPIPFMCVATNLETGETKIFEEGDLIKSIMASAAFPSLIDPVKIGEEIYVDGGIVINFPSKPLKDKGLDIIIGVNLSTGLSDKNQITDIIDVLNQIIDFGIQKETKNQLEHTDINIHPDLQGIKVTSFEQKKIILDKGYNEALKYTNILSQLPKREKENYMKVPINLSYSNLYKIDSLIVDDNFIYNKDYIQGKMRLKLPSVETYRSINKMVDKLYATNNFSLIDYEIIQKEEKNILKLHTTELDNPYTIKFGLHYDKIFKTGLLINFTLKRLLFNNSTISADIIIGDNPRYYLNYFIDNGFLPSFGIYASGMKFNIKNKENIATEQRKWFRNEVFIQSTWRDKYAVGFGISHDFFDSYHPILNTTQTEGYFNPYVYIKADTQNDRDFPTKGFNINIEGKYIDFFKINGHDFLQIKGSIDFSFPINSWITYRLESFAGFSTQDPSLFYKYHLGGIFGQNLGNFFNFNGYLLGQKKENNVLGTTNSFLFNIKKKYYIIPVFSVVDSFESIENINLLQHLHFSTGLTLGYKSPFGQIKLNYSFPIKTNPKGIFNIILGHWF